MKCCRFTVIIAALLVAQAAAGKTIGIWKDVRSNLSPGITNTLDNAGWDIVWLQGNDLENEEKLAKTDVIILTGGWGRYFFPSPRSRINLVRYAAGGKGVLAAGFRSGYVRTANRPMFPEIGEVFNRVTSSWIGPHGESELAKAFNGKAFASGGHDHLCIRIGKWGTQFCSSGGDAVGSFGDYYHGRVVVYGGHFMYQMVDETRADAERLFLAVLKYLSGSPKVSAAEAELAKGKAELALLRRELLWTYTADDRGPDRRPGLLTEIRDNLSSEPDAVAYRLDYYANFLPKGDAAKCRSFSGSLKRMTNSLRAFYVRELAELRKKTETATLSVLAMATAINSGFVDIEKIKKRLSGRINRSTVEKAKAFADEMRPKVKAAKKAALEKEIAGDLLKVPSLVAALSSKDAAVRYEAALEIGRISPENDAAAVKALCAALVDKDAKVRKQAATSLGWMQARGAVDALTANLSAPCPRDRRRALQALGLIGDKKAIPAVMKMLDDPEDLTRRVAMTALGHLKAVEAVGRLMEIAGNDKLEKQYRTIAILALGDIGDKRALPLLEKLMAGKSDIQLDRRTRIPWRNFLSNKKGIGITVATELALKRLAAGGRAKPGVKQPEEYRSRDEFYAITKKCNFFAGRTETVRGVFRGAGQKLLWAHIKNAGFTGVHCAWGWPSGYTPEGFTEIVREAGDLGLIWIDVMSGWVRCDYATSEAVISHYEEADIPAYRGVWAEETWPENGGTPEQFREFLRERYGKDWAKTLRLSEEEVKAAESLTKWVGFGCGGPDKRGAEGFKPPWDGALRTLVLEFNGVQLEKAWGESQDYLRSRRKGFAQTYVISTADPTKVIGGIQALEGLDSAGHESYESFGRFSTYYIERYRNGGAPRSIMSEQYHWYCPSNAHALRGFWANAIHSKCYYNFALHQMFEQPSWYDNWSWERGRWDAGKEVFLRVAKTPELYEISPTAANAAVLFSERCSSAVKEQVYFQVALPTRNDHTTMAAWTALNQNQIPTDVLWVETLDASRLAKYKFLYLPTAKYITDREVGELRKWVAAGGVLVAEGASSLFGGHSLKNRGNYALSDVFGCDWKETRFRTGEDSDTFATRPRSKVSAYKVVPGFDDLLHIDDAIHRDVKPVRSIITAVVRDDALDALPGIAKGAEIEMDGAFGFDIVKPTTAKVLAQHKGNPALLVNEFGKGRCYFIPASNFSLAHVTSRWEMMPGRLDFWKNVVEVIGSIADAGYAAVGAAPCARLEGVSREVELSVADFGDKYVVHMLDYDVHSQGVAGAKLTIPGNRAIKSVRYPGARSPLKPEGDGRSYALRDFKVYDMLVVEFADAEKAL